MTTPPFLFICEGEPDCICGLSHGLEAVTCTAGAGTWRTDWNARLAGRDVIICYDNDQAGRTGAAKVAKKIARDAATVSIVRWPEWMAKGGDLTDWLVKHRRSVEDLLALAEEQEAPPPDDSGLGRFWARLADGRSAFRPRILADELMAEMDLATDPETGICYRWTGAFWQQTPLADVRRQALIKMEGTSTTAKANDAAAQAVDLSRLDDDGGMNREPDWLTLQDGAFNLASGERVDFERGHYATYQLGVSFDPRTPGDCPRWKRFLAECIGDPKVVAELQEFYGYCLTRETRYEKALLLIGPGGDGKSTALNVLQALVGEPNVSNVALDSLDNEFHRATLLNKVLNVYTEIDARAFTTGYFKAIVSGDRIGASYKHMDPFEFRPFCKLAFSANRLPRALDNSAGFFRRILPINFKRGFDTPDPFLLDALLEELPGVFAWAWAGLVRLRERGGFTASQATQAALEEYEAANNPVKGFVEERCELDPQAVIPKQELYEAYRAYTKSRGFSALNDSRFARELFAVAPAVRPVKRTVYLAGGAARQVPHYAGLQLEVFDA